MTYFEVYIITTKSQKCMITIIIKITTRMKYMIIRDVTDIDQIN